MRALAAALLACWISDVAVAAGAVEPPLIVAVDKCPAKSACVVVDIVVVAKRDDPTRIVGPAKSDCGGKIYHVRGRLRGSAVRAYNLALQGECMADCADGRAAYFGRTARNAPIILTNLGRFEVVDDGLEVGAAEDLIVLDEGRRAVAKYIGNYAGSGDYFVERARVFMRHGDGPCLTAPQERSGLLAIVDARHCPTGPTADEPLVALKDLTPASQTFLERWAEPQKGNFTVDEALQSAIHLSPTGLVVVQINDNCYQ